MDYGPSEYKQMKVYDGQFLLSAKRTHLNIYENKFDLQKNIIGILSVDEFVTLVYEFIENNINFLIKKHKLQITVTKKEIETTVCNFVEHHFRQNLSEQFVHKRFRDAYENNIFNKLINKYEKDSVPFYGQWIQLTTTDGIDVSSRNYCSYCIILPIFFGNEINKITALLIVQKNKMQEIIKKIDN